MKNGNYYHLMKNNLFFSLVTVLLLLSFVSTVSAANQFKISIDEQIQQKWGLRYPVTYIFDVSEITEEGAEVLRRDNLSEQWVVLEKKMPGEFFNGIECVRLDTASNKVYVSVGFNTTNTIYLRFENVGSVGFSAIAKYYDDRWATFTLGMDNHGLRKSANHGAPWQGMENDNSDKYQAAIHACRMFQTPVSSAINAQAPGAFPAMWDRMQEELDRGDAIWEPAAHTRSHLCFEQNFIENGYSPEILGCRDDILDNLTTIPYGQHVFDFVLPCGYEDSKVKNTAVGEFLFVRFWDEGVTTSAEYASWNNEYDCYAGYETKEYDELFILREPMGRYYEEDVNELNSLFDEVYSNGGIFLGTFHPDRYQNSVLFDTSPPVDGVSGSSLMEHLAHVARRTDVWYVANGWLYAYKMVYDNARVETQGGCPLEITLDNHRDITMLRAMRNSMANNIFGLVLTAVYYQHSAEVSAILATHPDLRSELRALVMSNLTAATAFIKEGKATISGDTLQTAIGFLNKLKEKGSVRLQADINLVVKSLTGGYILDVLGITTQ